MTDTQPRVVTRYLGGDTAHRSFFGGTHSRSRIIGVAIFVVAGMILTPLIGWPALVIAAAGTLLVVLLTQRTHRGSIIERSQRRRRWKSRLASGTDAFTPYDEASWNQLTEAMKSARGKADRWAAFRERAAMRSTPDGADGMGWLQYGRREAGIAWHSPVGERSYLSVVFAVTGQLRGIESGAVLGRAAEAWGQFLASRAAPGSLVGDVQTVTRVVPADTALQEFWVLENLDPDAPKEAIASYDQVLRRTGAGAMVQRHFITVQWPLTPAFTDAASHFGADRDGWRGLMREEVASVYRGLSEARLGSVDVLTARQVTALMLHQQNPSRPLDYVADVHPSRLGLKSHDEFSAHVVEDVDPVTGDPVEWYHRTARIDAAAMVTAPRTQLWMLGLLVGGLNYVRTMSFHIHLVPAAQAKAAAQKDSVRDQADALAKAEKGIQDIDDTALTAAKRRRNDLRPGSGQHGVSWTGYITISTRSHDELLTASRQLEEACSTELGIEYLEWQDSYQAAASGTTWPIGRGQLARDNSLSARFDRLLAGRSDKEAIA